MKKILIAGMVLCGLLFTACTNDNIKGDTWFKTRVSDPQATGTLVYIDSVEVEVTFTERSAGEQRYQSYTVFPPDEFRSYDSVRVNRDTVYPFEYDFSNSTGLARFKDGRVLAFNVRNDKLIMEGVTYNKR